jgi:signal transduction histidine kinase
VNRGVFSSSALSFRNYENALIRIGPLAIATIGLVVLFAWIYDIPQLKSIIPDAASMKFSTAVAFVCSGVAIYFVLELLTSKRRISSAASQVILPAAVLIIILFMSTHIASAILSRPSGIDNLFVKEAPDTPFTASPGRPSEVTMVNFLAISVAATSAIIQPSSMKKILSSMGLVIGLSAAIALVGYAVGVPILYYALEGITTGMAIHTAILFLIAGLTFTFLSRKIGQTTTPNNNNQSEYSALEPLEKNRFVSIRTKFSGLLLVLSVVPILFVGGVALNNTSSLPTEYLGGSIAVLGVATAVSATIFALALSHSILRPLFSLRHAMNEVAKGNYEVAIPVESTDEIGLLAKNFAVMKEAVLAVNSNLERLVNLRTAELQDSKKQLEVAVAQLKEQERVMKEFINIAAHEMKNPITPILVTTQRLATREFDKKIVFSKEEFDLIAQNAIRLKRLSDDILDVARIENNNGIKLERVTLNLSDLLRDAIADSKPLARPGVELSYKGSDDLVIEADRGKIQQVVLNILHNALKFTREGIVQVGLSANATKSEVVVAIKDKGSGIDHEILPRLFSKYVTKSEKGTGLGLFISKNIIEAHGGKIWAENNADGKGATFLFSLPLRGALLQDIKHLP